MRNYRHACKAAKVTGYPTSFTGLKSDTARIFLRGIVESVPKSIKEDAIQKYNAYHYQLNQNGMIVDKFELDWI